MADLGTRWHLPDAAFKAYPTCHYIHPFLEAVEALMARGLTTETLHHATAHVPPPEVALICDPWARRQAPASGYDAKWALAWCIAARIRGPVTVETFARAPDPAITALAQRIAWTPMADHGFPARFAARLDVTLRDGRTLSAAVPNVRGAPDRPIAAQAVAQAEDAILTLDAPGALARLRAALTSSGSEGTA